MSRHINDQDSQRPVGGFADTVGYQLARWADGQAEVTLEVGQGHVNRSGYLHGGVLTTLIDTACGYAGTFSADPDRLRRGVTLSLECQFIAAIRPGDLLRAKAQQSGGGRSIFFTRCEVFNQEGQLVGAGSGTFKYIRV